jgi:hypothetical protein
VNGSGTERERQTTRGHVKWRKKNVSIPARQRTGFTISNGFLPLAKKKKKKILLPLLLHWKFYACGYEGALYFSFSLSF